MSYFFSVRFALILLRLSAAPLYWFFTGLYRHFFFIYINLVVSDGLNLFAGPDNLFPSSVIVLMPPLWPQ